MKNDEHKDQEVRRTVYMTPPSPPPSHYPTSPFESIEAWLIYLCDANRNCGVIDYFHFLLTKTSSGYLLSLEGSNNYELKENVSAYRFDFKPSTHEYFTLSQGQYQNLSETALKKKVFTEILDFIDSERFKASFLSKSSSINLNFAGRIWQK